KVHRGDAALCDGTGHQEGERGLCDREIGAIAGGAGDFQAAVDAWLGLPHVVLRLGSGTVHRKKLRIAYTFSAAASLSPRTSVRLPSSILKALCSRGSALRNAASAAAWNAPSSASRSCRATSASSARQGTVATPPSAMRASRMRLPSRSSATAAEASANS